ncbi:hypothetical protein KBTX_04255 [wastewater metagenome]|uniref:Uncharacterized protein n=2 Tax=unclassified sequences TaxID=12908 RepID=A0A5B8RFQ3_9ZZZZ|nr:hypothetical protein KBTEX_04255 [uncultured organism]
MLVELLDGLLGELREMAAALYQRVGGEHAHAAAVGEDGEAVAVRRGRESQCLHRREQLAEGVHPEHAGAPEGGVVDLVGARQRPGV